MHHTNPFEPFVSVCALRRRPAGRTDRRLLCAIIAFAAALSRPAAGADIIADGRARAQIVIDAQAPRMTVLAAVELQSALYRLTGVDLPLGLEPDDRYPVTIYVGRSAGTDALGIDPNVPPHGAFRMRSGTNWLALIGDDRDFVPPAPWPRNHGETEAARLHVEWDRLTGATWGNPMWYLWRQRNRGIELVPEPQREAQAAAYAGIVPVVRRVRGTDVWMHDRSGSFNAVTAFLDRLGMRWYLPGPLGEVAPALDRIPLPQVDETVVPDFALREFFFSRYFNAGREDILWGLRLGVNSGGDVLGYNQPHQAHGSRTVHRRPEMRAAHPEYYALRGGGRMVDYWNTGMPCLSHPGLRDEHVRYARAVFEHYDEPAVSLCPQDGFRKCECPLCDGLDHPERGMSGRNADYVWGFLNAVADELYETHPDRLVTATAYASYRLPPEIPGSLSPNLLVGLFGARREFANPENPGAFDRYWDWLEQWRALHPAGRFFRYVHYLRTTPGRGWEGVPAIYPRGIARDLRDLKDVSLGDFVEVSRTGAQHWHAPGINHLNLYVSARLYWDAGMDIEAFLERYTREFYGPAAEPMRAVIDFAEAHWLQFPDPAHRDKVETFLELLAAARATAGETIYGARIDQLIEDTEPVKRFLVVERLERGDVPEAVARPTGHSDGLKTYSLRINETGETPALETRFSVAWDGDGLLFDIQCAEPDMANLYVGGRMDNDPEIWHGDNIEILLETPRHAYYQIAVNPKGAVVSVDRSRGINLNWNAHAEVHAEQGDGYWRLMVRIPVVADSDDHLNYVIGPAPRPDQPWFFQVARHRDRFGEERSMSVFSPTGEPINIHVREQFGRLTAPRQLEPTPLK